MKMVVAEAKTGIDSHNSSATFDSSIQSWMRVTALRVTSRNESPPCITRFSAVTFGIAYPRYDNASREEWKPLKCWEMLGKCSAACRTQQHGEHAQILCYLSRGPPCLRGVKTTFSLRYSLFLLEVMKRQWKHGDGLLSSPFLP